MDGDFVLADDPSPFLAGSFGKRGGRAVRGPPADILRMGGGGLVQQRAAQCSSRRRAMFVISTCGEDSVSTTAGVCFGPRTIVSVCRRWRPTATLLWEGRPIVCAPPPPLLLCRRGAAPTCSCLAHVPLWDVCRCSSRGPTMLVPGMGGLPQPADPSARPNRLWEVVGGGGGWGGPMQMASCDRRPCLWRARTRKPVPTCASTRAAGVGQK